MNYLFKLLLVSQIINNDALRIVIKPPAYKTIYGVVKNIGPFSSKFITEAEIKHARIAMVASITLPVIEILNNNQQGIYIFSQQSFIYQISLLSLFSLSEISQLKKAYKYPMQPQYWYYMKDKHIPGEYGFDPLNIANTKEKLNTNKKQEIFNGRIAMLSVFGIISQELLTDKTIFDTLL